MWEDRRNDFERGELLATWERPLGEEVHAARALNRAVASASPRVGIVSTAELSHRVVQVAERDQVDDCLLYTSPSPRDA